MFIICDSLYFSVHLKLLIINNKRQVEVKQAFINSTDSNMPSTDLGIGAIVIDFCFLSPRLPAITPRWRRKTIKDPNK